MFDRRLTIASAIVVALMSVANLALGGAVPNDARFAVHWNLAGKADLFAAKTTALFLLPLLAATIGTLFALLPRIEPMREGLSRSAPLYRAVWAATLAVLALLHGVVLATALGWTLPVDRIAFGAIGVLFMVVGNALPKSRRMALIGFRTPWTLANEDVWIATQRLAGRLTLGCGAVLTGLALAGAAPGLTQSAIVATVLLIVVVPTVFSWREAQRHRMT